MRSFASAASTTTSSSPRARARAARLPTLLGALGLALAALPAACSEETDPAGGGDSQSSSGGTGGGTADGGPGQQGSASSSSSGGSSSGGTPDGGPGGDGGASKPTVLYAMTGSGDGKIRVFRVDRATGDWQSTGTFDAGSSPSFLAADTAKGRVYAVDESGGGRVLAFSFDRAAGTLAPLGSQPSGGPGPTHLSLDATRTHVLVAMYNAGRSAVFPVGADGSLGAATDTKDSGEKAHLAVTNPSGGYAFVPCLGVNRIVQYVFDPATGRLAPNPTAAFVNAPAGSGPRHLDFSPDERFVYGLNELASSMSTYTYDKAKGTLAHVETTTMLPAGFAGANTGAEVYVHPTGKLVFGSNRGHDSIAVFRVDAPTGRLTLASHAKTNGRTPRSFGLDPSGTWLFAANQQSGTVQPFKVDVAAARLAPVGEPRAVPSPTFVGLFAFETP